MSYSMYYAWTSAKNTFSDCIESSHHNLNKLCTRDLFTLDYTNVGIKISVTKFLWDYLSFTCFIPQLELQNNRVPRNRLVFLVPPSQFFSFFLVIGTELYHMCVVTTISSLRFLIFLSHGWVFSYSFFMVCTALGMFCTALASNFWNRDRFFLNQNNGFSRLFMRYQGYLSRTFHNVEKSVFPSFSRLSQY